MFKVSKCYADTMFDKKTYRCQTNNLKYPLTLDNEIQLEVDLT